MVHTVIYTVYKVINGIQSYEFFRNEAMLLKANSKAKFYGILTFQD